MRGKVFVDSNIFLYTLDRSDRGRRSRAKRLLQGLADSARVVISTQVLNEVFSVATRKLGIDAMDAKEFVRGLFDLDVIMITPEIIECAIDCSVIHRINYWDALMIAAADAAKCETLWTEDMSHGASIRGVQIENPFKIRSSARQHD